MESCGWACRMMMQRRFPPSSLRAKREHLERFQEFYLQAKAMIMALTVLYVPYSLDGGVIVNSPLQTR